MRRAPCAVRPDSNIEVQSIAIDLEYQLRMATNGGGIWSERGEYLYVNARMVFTDYASERAAAGPWIFALVPPPSTAKIFGM